MAAIDRQLNKSTDTLTKYCMVTLGGAMYAVGINLFITPHGLYAGGIMGVSQLLRTFILMLFPINIPESFDLAGIVYYIVNIPLFVIAFKSIGKHFFLRTLFATTAITLLTSVVPVPAPLLDDCLTSCVVGGLVTGCGVGFMLRYGGSGGGLDIIGMYMTKKYTDASVGKVSLICNAVLYLICAILFSIETAVYSIIFTAVMSITLDRIHHQNIMVRAMIFTKVDQIADPIMNELGRGVTEWDGQGAYTHEAEHILVTIISKYEMTRLRRIVLSRDPRAFITYDRISNVDGNFLKKL